MFSEGSRGRPTGKGWKNHPEDIYSSLADRAEPWGTHSVPSSSLALLRGLRPQRHYIRHCIPIARMTRSRQRPGRAACERATERMPTWCTQTLHLSQKTISLPSSPSGERHTSQTTSSSYSMPNPSCVSMARAIFWWHRVSNSSSTRSSVSSSSSGLSVRTAGEGVRSLARQGRRTEGSPPTCGGDVGKCTHCHGPQLHHLETEWAGPFNLKDPWGWLWYSDF